MVLQRPLEVNGINMSEFHRRFIKHFKLPFSVSEEVLVDILESVEERVIEYILDELDIRLLNYPLEAEVSFLNDKEIAVVLYLTLIISPLSPQVTKKEEIADLISEKFFKLFEEKLKAITHVKENDK